MRPNAYRQNNLESEVGTASPLKLVQLLYAGALEAVRSSRRSVRAGDIAARSRSISQANAILNELALSLDHAQSPELSLNLAELYDYVLRLLIEANASQAEPPLAEAESLLITLAGAWDDCARGLESTSLLEPDEENMFVSVSLAG